MIGKRYFRKIVMNTTQLDKLRMESQISAFFWRKFGNTGPKILTCSSVAATALDRAWHGSTWPTPGAYPECSHECLSLRILHQRDEKQKGKNSCLRSLKALFYHLRVGHPGHPDSDHHLCLMLWLPSHSDVLLILTKNSLHGKEI